MKKSLRLALLACASFIGLAFAAPALASYKPSLTVEQTSYKLGAATTVDTFIFAPQNDDATAKLTIFSPAGYGANLTAAPGTKIGHVVALVKAKALSGAILPLAGDVLVANPTDPTILAAAARCTPGVTNQTVWILNTSLQGQTIAIPVFVNKVGSLVTEQVCLPSPDIPPASGGATFGAQLVSADFTTKGIFTNAGTKGGYEWASIFTPYTAGTGTPNPAGSNEWRTLVGLPQSLTFKRVKSKPSLVTFAGALTIPTVSGANIQLHLYFGRKGGPAPNAVSAGDPKAKSVKTKKLKANGKYTISRPRVRVKTFFQMRFENYGVDCNTPSPSSLPVPCKGEDLAPMTSAQIKVTPAKKRRHR
jgi:hypothetical protein